MHHVAPRESAVPGARSRLPPQPIDANLLFFDSFAGHYDRWAGGLHARVARRLADLLSARPGQIVLDIGCGTGLVTAALAEQVAPAGHVIGLDVSEGMLAVARSRAPANTDYLSISADHRLWFRDEAFEVVALGDSLAYLADPFQSLEESCRVLRPGGRVGLALRSRALHTSAQEVFYRLLEDLVDAHPMVIPRHAGERGRLGEPAVITELLHDAGFRDVQITNFVTGARTPSARAWIELIAGAGPRPHAVLTTLGAASREDLERQIEKVMVRLGEEAFHYHESFTFALACK